MASIDQTFARGFKLMLSNEPDATAQLRAMLDEALMNKYGVCLSLPEDIEPEEAAPLPNAVDSNIPENEFQSSSNDSKEPATVDFEDSFSMHLTDLSCVVCGQLNVGVRNQLIECSGCQKLYHQDCHSPPIKELIDANSVWNCTDCITQNQAERKTESAEEEDCLSSVSLTIDSNDHLHPGSSHQSSFGSKTSSHLKMKRHSLHSQSSYEGSHRNKKNNSGNRHSR